MNLEILEIKELENGGAELIIQIDEQTRKYLVNYAIIEMIKKGLVEVRELHEENEAKNED
jgi:hypothetical protein